MAGQKLFIPVAKGLMQGVDERVAEMDRPLKLENVQIDKRGTLRKRHGFQAFPSDLETAGVLGGVRSLFSTGTELCLIGAHHLYAYSDELERWVLRGPVSPGAGRIRTVFRDERSYEEADCAEHGGYVMRVGRRERREPGNTTASFHEIALGIDEADGSRFSPVMDAGHDGSDVAPLPHAVRAGHVDGQLIATWLRGVGTSTATLRYSAWSVANTAASQPSAPADLIASSIWTSLSGIRTYDLDSDGDAMVIAYIATDRLIKVTLWPTIATLPTLSLTLDGTGLGEGVLFSRVAIHFVEGEKTIYVLAVGGGGDSTLDHSVIAWKVTYPGNVIGIDWGPRIIYSTDEFGVHFTNLGIRRGLNPLGGETLAMVWTEMHTPTGGDDIAMYSQMDESGLLAPSAPEKRYNLATKARPFWHLGYAYSACSTSVAVKTVDHLARGLFTAGGAWKPITGGLGNLFECEVVMRWDAGGSWVAGAYNIGYGESLGLDHGNCNRVWESDQAFPSSARAHRWMTIATSRAVINSTKHMADEVEIDMRKPVLATTVERGRACVGGALVVWYDGESTMEVGHLVAPVPSAVLEVVATAGADKEPLLADTYFYSAVWYSWDASGTLHRSIPSVFIQKAFTASGSPANDAVELRARMNPATNRYINRGGFVVWHKAVNDIQVRLTRPLEVVKNEVDSAFSTEPTYDEGQATADSVQETLYTEGGELENVAPEGARLPVVVGGRLWLGDFMRRSRLQFSKPFAPGSASEFAIAPEFNEGFGVVLPDGEAVTGMGVLDSNLVVFTEAAIYVVDASGGPDDGGAGPQFEPRRISSDAGCMEARSIVAYPEGLLFQSKAGIYRIDRGFGLAFVGTAVEDELAAFPVVSSAVLIPEETQVRLTVHNDDHNDGRILVYDYSADAWMTWRVEKAARSAVVPVAACYHQPDPRRRGTYVVAEYNGTLFREDTTTHADVSGLIKMSITTGWVQAAQHGGWQRVQNVTAMCSRLGETEPKLSIDTDFHQSGGSLQVYQWSDADVQAFPRAPEAPLRMKLIDQKSHAVRIRYEDDTGGAGMELSGFVLDVVQKRGATKVSEGQRA
jgi:hypothetical protein